MKIVVVALTFWLSVLTSFAQTSIANGAAQDAADALRAFAGSDAAFIVDGNIKDKYDKTNLATILKFPNDEVVVVDLTGTQVLQALERSISLYPQINQSFLHISGFDVKFNPNAAPNKRIVSVTAGGVPLKDSKTYTVAMSSSLARGSLGYFKVWDNSKASKTIKGKTVEDAVRGKSVTGSPSRWSAQPV